MSKDNLQEISEKLAFSFGPFTKSEDYLVMDTSQTMYQIAISLGRDLNSIKARRKELNNPIPVLTVKNKFKTDSDSPRSKGSWKRVKDGEPQTERMKRYLDNLQLWASYGVEEAEDNSEYDISQNEVKSHFLMFTGEELTTREVQRVEELFGFNPLSSNLVPNWAKKGLNYDYLNHFVEQNRLALAEEKREKEKAEREEEKRIAQYKERRKLEEEERAKTYLDTRKKILEALDMKFWGYYGDSYEEVLFEIDGDLFDVGENPDGDEIEAWNFFYECWDLGAKASELSQLSQEEILSSSQFKDLFFVEIHEENPIYDQSWGFVHDCFISWAKYGYNGLEWYEQSFMAYCLEGKEDFLYDPISNSFSFGELQNLLDEDYQKMISE